MVTVLDVTVACSCGRTFTPAEFRKLPILGIQPDGMGGAFQLRDCPDCRSTLSVELPAEPAKPGLAKARARVSPSPTPATPEALLAAFHELAPPATSTGVCMPFGIYTIEVAS